MNSSTSTGSALSNLNDEKHNITNTENHLKKWKLPKVSKKTVYQMGNFYFKKHNSISTIEQIHSLDDKVECIRLLDEAAIRRHRRDYRYLHVGLVQVGVKPLTREKSNRSILLCLRDRRFLDFNQSLLGVLQSSLDDAPVYFNCYPDIMFNLHDPDVWNCLALNIKLQNLEMRETSRPVVLIYRVVYKCLLDPFNSAAKKSSCMDQTLIFQTNIKRPSVDIPRIIKWSEIEFPEEWKLREKNPPKKQEPSYSPFITQPDGSIRIRFPPRS